MVSKIQEIEMYSEVVMKENIPLNGVTINKGAVLKVIGEDHEGNDVLYRLHGVIYRKNVRIEVELSANKDQFESLRDTAAD